MEVSGIIAEIDAQIAKLQQARALLSGAAGIVKKAGPGRPKGSVNTNPGKRRKLSKEARKRIADAQKRRWAEHRKTLAK